jgi:cholesterol oxidase
MMLSQPISTMTSHYGVVIIGSGYGGSIMASRVARAGRGVCLVERGRERRPGDFADGLISATRDIQTRTKTRRAGPR